MVVSILEIVFRYHYGENFYLNPIILFLSNMIYNDIRMMLFNFEMNVCLSKVTLGANLYSTFQEAKIQGTLLEDYNRFKFESTSR